MNNNASRTRPKFADCRRDTKCADLRRGFAWVVLTNLAAEYNLELPADSDAQTEIACSLWEFLNSMCALVPLLKGHPQLGPQYRRLLRDFLALHCSAAGKRQLT